MPGPGGRSARPRIERASDVRGTLRRLLATLRPYRWSFISVFIFVIISTLLSLLTPYLIGVAIDKSIATHDLTGLWNIALLMLAAYIGVWLAQ